MGRLLVDYGELKIELALSMGYAISDKHKVMSDFFKTRGARRSPTEDERVAVKKIVMAYLCAIGHTDVASFTACYCGDQR